MGSADKFCLRWNDFESNISSSFRDLRLNQDFFDVSLAVEEDHVLQAHKVILAACSPFFRNVLNKQNMTLGPYNHPHPVIYLRGIKMQDLRHVLDFMYHGEVNVAQDDLNSFLAVAEDLQIKGLTQDDNKGQTKPKKEPGKRGPDPPDNNHGPPIKKSKVIAPKISNSPSVARAAAANPVEDDDVIEDVTPSVVKQEAQVSVGDIHIDESSYGEGAEDYGDGAGEDYGQYAEEGGEDYGEGEPQPGTSDGSKDQLEDEIISFLVHISGREGGDRGFSCLACGYFSKQKTNAKNHVEANHVKLGRYVCRLCGKVTKTKNTLASHMSVKHRNFKRSKLSSS